MKKSEFKKLLKPIVKECIRESLLEDGLLSGVISEVVRSLNPKPIVKKQAPQAPPAQKSFTKNLAKEQIKENRKKLMEAISSDSYGGINIFEGVTPMAGQASPEGQAGSPLGGIGSKDAGLDISGIINVGGKKWKSLMG